MKKNQQKGIKFPDLIKRLSQPRYRGKHIVVMGKKIFTARTGHQASALLDSLTRKYPHQSVTVSYISKADSLILTLACKD